MPRSAGDTRVVAFDIRRLDIPLIEPFSISSGSPTVAANVMVRVELVAGSLGFGEAAPFEAVSGETQHGTYDALMRFRPSLLGRDAVEWRSISAELGLLLHANPAARCAVEQALLDALSRHVGIALTGFFGGLDRDLTTDLTITASSTEHAVARAVQAAQRGFDTLKVKVGARHWGEDVDRLVAISEAVPGVDLIADGNEGFTAAAAGEFLRALAADRVHLSLFEQPVAAADLEALASIERDFGVRVCADESVRSPRDAIRVAATGGISVVNVKLMKLGVVGALDVLSIASGAGMTCMIGGMVESRVSMSFAAALAMAWGDLVAFVDLDTPLFMESDCASGGMTYSGPVIGLEHGAVGTGIERVSCFD